MPRAKNGEVQEYFQDVILKCESDECLLWPFGQNGFGYGLFRFDGKSQGVHRVVCRLKNGEPPTIKHEAAHNCGNSLCCNYRHIRWATTLENEHDKIIHGTLQVGEQSSNSKLTEKEVLEIVSLKNISTHRKIAERYGVGNGTVSMIMNGQSWGWLTGIKKAA